jgi:hypothetical protein
MAFHKFKNFWNVDIKDGVEGKAVVRSASVPMESAIATDVQMARCLRRRPGALPRPAPLHREDVQASLARPDAAGGGRPRQQGADRHPMVQVKTVDELMREGRPAARPVTMRQSQA